MNILDVTGLVLAGGMGRRMGGVDKGLVLLDERPMVSHVIERLTRQVGAIVINANQNVERYASLGYPVVSDTIGGFAGPLAGLHAGLSAACTPYVATSPCDSPFLPLDLVSRLAKGFEDARRAARGRAYVRAAASRVRAGRAVTSCRTSRRSSKAADARSTRGMQRCGSRRCSSTIARTPSATSTRPTSSPRLNSAVITFRLGDLAHGRDNNFQLVRLFAAACVVLFHSYALTGRWTHEPLWQIMPEANFGALGVKIFFVVSGFLVTQSWLARQSVAPFVAARVLRIYPALIAATLFTIALAGVSSSLAVDAVPVASPDDRLRVARGARVGRWCIASPARFRPIRFRTT